MDSNVIEMEIPAKTVLHFDKNWNLIKREEETTKVVLDEYFGRLLLKMLGITPEEAVDTIINKKEGTHNDEIRQ